jgi:EAL and modified HD-GYP domain-containing signal transduction protein
MSVPAITAVVGRQPIFDRELGLVAYELLYRPLPSSQRADDPAAPHRADGDQMTNEVIFAALGLGIERVTGGADMFCNADRGVLTGQLPISLPPRQTVVEIVESVDIDDEILAGCHALKAAGYRLAADDFTWFDGAEALLDVVDVVKIDLRMTPMAAVPELIARCRPFDVQLLAEKVETAGELAACRELNFDLFQGYHLGRTNTVSGPALGASRLAVMRLASAVLDDDVDYAVIEQILRPEPELSYQLVQLASIGRFGETRREVQSLRQALVWIGLNRLRGWIPALSLRPVGRATDTNLQLVLTRARTVELLADQLYHGKGDFAFTAGMFSGLDLLLGVPRSKLPHMLEIPPRLHAAVFDRDTQIGQLIGWVIDYEESGVLPPTDFGITRSVMSDAVALARRWAIRNTQVLDACVA